MPLFATPQLGSIIGSASFCNQMRLPCAELHVLRWEETSHSDEPHVAPSSRTEEISSVVRSLLALLSPSRLVGSQDACAA